MGRKAEPGILYYTMECDHTTHKKIKLLYNDHKADGYWVWQNILSYGYKTKGYYFDFSNEDELFLFADDHCKLSVELVRKIIDSAINRGLFDKDIAENYQVLTSDRMQEIYLYATSERRRKGTVIEIIKEFQLIEIAEDTRNISIVPCPNPVIPGNKEIVPRNNTKVKVEATEEEKKLKEQKAAYDGLKKDKPNVFRFIKTCSPTFIEPYIDMWNIWAGEHNKPKISFVTEKRRTHFYARIKEPQFNFLEILTKAHNSKLCCERTWFNYDFITKNKDNYIKVLEGSYDNETSQPAAEPVNAAEAKLEKMTK